VAHRAWGGMIRVRVAWYLLGAFLCTAGCGQVLGLDDYREVPAADSTDASGASDRAASSSDAAPRFDSGTNVADRDESGGQDATAVDSVPDEASTSDSLGDDSIGSDGSADDSSASDSGAGDSTANESGANDSSADSAWDGAMCSGDLSNIGTADFHVALTMTTTQVGMTALVNQRSACTSVVTFWSLRVWSGQLRAETGQAGGNRYVLTSTGSVVVNDGRPHDVVLRRVAGVMTIYIDGVASGSTGSAASFGVLAPLQSGTDACDGRSGTVAFVGVIANLCVASP
jgi:hypothetical protein